MKRAKFLPIVFSNLSTASGSAPANLNQPARLSRPGFGRSALALLTVASSVAVVATALTLPGCDRDDSDGIKSYSVSKTLPIGSEPEEDRTRGSAPALPIQWTVPPGWTAKPPPRSAAGIEPPVAAFGFSAEHPELMVTVSAMAANQSLGENVRRWQGQVGLPKSPDDQLASVVTHVKLANAEADIVDLTGPPAAEGAVQKRAYGAIVPHGNATWFFKLMGPANAVGPQQSAFNLFVRSVRFDDAGPQDADASPPPAPPIDGSTATAPANPGTGDGSIAYEVPPAWNRDPAENPMRVAAFDLHGADTQTGRVSVSKFHGLPGSLLMNINRWRGEAGLAAVSDPSESAAPTQLAVGGAEAARYQFEGTATNGAAPAIAVDAVIVVRGETNWFFKLQGPAALVNAERSTFTKFLSSVRFTGEAH